ncbi:unnamed protein product [Hydatigera taeniaeformis]|uniref:Helitron_like_N domain-containing protein n=1 Tax=Hydatigena taeniaeformis TaxID=6205 RepID=A0A0R3XDE3_HYDTA|nr:unnamed protein product [Hydatigera taeniaeformis]
MVEKKESNFLYIVARFTPFTQLEFIVALFSTSTKRFQRSSCPISQNIEDYRKNMQLTDDQFRNLERLLDEIVKGREMALLMLGMPLQSWSEVYFVLRPVAKGLLNASPIAYP